MILGIIGGGQLGRMLAQAAVPLGIRTRVLDPAADACAGQVTELVQARFTDARAVGEFASGVDVLTYEFENILVESLANAVHGGVRVFPPLDALETSQDRLREKECFTRLGIEVPRYRAVNSEKELAEAIDRVGLPAVLKTRRLGYDGKGQATIRSSDDAADAWLAVAGASCVLEAFVDFDAEFSVIGVRVSTGEVMTYPATRNVHRHGILHSSFAPGAGLSPVAIDAGRDAVVRLLEHFAYIGVLAVEFFAVGDRIVVNEMAPRVHNSGHWTIDGTDCSQFTSHVRAVCGLPLVKPAMRGLSAMRNLVGAVPPVAALRSLPGTHVHDYGKAARVGRKVGHVTVVANSAIELELRFSALESMLPPSAFELALHANPA